MADTKSEATTPTSESTEKPSAKAIKETMKAVSDKATSQDKAATNVETKTVKGGDKPMAKVKAVDPTGKFDYSKATAYAVQPGDDLFSVAQKFKVAMEQLRYFNHIRPGRNLRVGKTIYIPNAPVYVPVGK